MKVAEAFPVLQYECPICKEIHECTEICNANESTIEICDNTGKEVEVLNRYFIDIQ